MSKLTKYSLDHEVRSSFEMGQLIPFLCQEVVPGDKYRVQSSTLVRLQPMLAPLMHRIDYYQRYYYIPYRLLIPNYEQLLTDPDSNQVVPSMDKYLVYSASTVRDLIREKPLLEYFGLSTSNTKVSPDSVIRDINATPLLAYYLIYNHYYMRSDLDKRYIDQLRPEHFESAELKKYIGNVMYVNEGLDYFTSAKTSTQYGNMVQLDMDGNNTITVPEMRLAERLQSFRERLFRVGGKYVNYIKEFFDVEPLDARVQIPKYLGGDSYVLSVSDVDQTAPSQGGYVGESYGKSVSVNRTGQIQYDVYEHGLIIGLHFVRPRPSNIGGCPKLFTRRTYFDFFNPHFSALGYQEVEQRELDVCRSKAVPFGYVPRYDEYRYGNDIVSGDFRRSLNYWHLSRDISKEHLSVDFVTCRPDNRIFNVVDTGDVSLCYFVGKLDRAIIHPHLNQFLPISVSGFIWVPKGSVKAGDKVVLERYIPKSASKQRYQMTLDSLQFVDDKRYISSTSKRDFAFDFAEDEVSFSIDSNTMLAFEYEDKGMLLSGIQNIVFGGVKGMCLICSVVVDGNIFVEPQYQERLDEQLRLFKSFPGTLSFNVNSNYYPGKLDNNHVLSVTYNNVDVLRPLARYDGNVLR